MEGARFDAIAAINENQNSPFFDYYKDLKSRYEELLQSNDLKKKNKVVIEYTTLEHYFSKFCNHGPWNNPTQIKKLEDGFFEFKIRETNLRILFYYDNSNRSVIILTHTFEKQSNKTPKSELERMKSIKKNFEKFRENKIREGKGK